MGTVAPHRRGIAAGARVLVQNTGAVISIAFVLAIVTSAVPKNVLFSVFSGLANHISTAQLTPFISNMHTALWCLTAVSLVGRGDLRRPAQGHRGRRTVRQADEQAARPRAGPRPTASPRRRCDMTAEPPSQRAHAAHRRARRALRHDAADDPLLRGDRPARRRHRTHPGQAPRLHARPTSSGSGRSSACATCSACRWNSSPSCWRPRAPARTCAASSRRPKRRPSAGGSSTSCSSTSAPSWSWSAHA